MTMAQQARWSRPSMMTMTVIMSLLASAATARCIVMTMQSGGRKKSVTIRLPPSTTLRMQRRLTMHCTRARSCVSSTATTHRLYSSMRMIWSAPTIQTVLAQTATTSRHRSRRQLPHRPRQLLLRRRLRRHRYRTVHRTRQALRRHRRRITASSSTM